ncbi:MAG: PAS domain-containing protein, partial [Oryzihumus sp.]
MLLSSDSTIGLADMLQNLPDAVVVAAADGQVVHANPALTRLLGLDPDELVGSTLSDLMPARLRAAHSAGF